MRVFHRHLFALLAIATLLLTACGDFKKTETQPASPSAQVPPATPKVPAVSYLKVDPATAGIISGTIRFIGARPRPQPIDMSEDPACVEAHHSKAHDESLVVSPTGKLANVFLSIKSGLEGKRFQPSAIPVTIDQRGCWFHPRVIGIQAGQPLRVENSDPVTHNIHPLAQSNREWNHSQGPGDPPLARKFLKPEMLIPVKCNIHSWMHAFIGVVDNPYFAVSDNAGSFQIRNLPPGRYVLEAWQEILGTQEQTVTVQPSAVAQANFTFKRK